MNSFVFTVAVAPTNYESAPSYDQANMDPRDLLDAMEKIFDASYYGLKLQVPDFFLDLKATSDLRRVSEGNMFTQVQAISNLLLKHRTDKGIISNPELDAIVKPLNSHHHCPSFFFVVLTGSDDQFFEWANVRMAGHLSWMKNGKDFMAKLPARAQKGLSMAFDVQSEYSKDFTFKYPESAAITPSEIVAFGTMMDEIMEQRLTGKDLNIYMAMKNDVSSSGKLNGRAP